MDVTLRTAGPTPLVAPAKLTLALRVTGVRDDGFHEIDAEMVSVDLCDLIHIVETDAPTSLAVDGDCAAGVPTDASNLVARALAAVGRRAEVRITKNIPHGGGLGGGSSDAAAVLRWAGYRSRGDSELAAGLGADVPFCVVGGRARVTGIGEHVEPLPYLRREFTLVVPPLAVSTPAVYRAWDELGGPTDVDSGNDLEPAALLVAPELVGWKSRITEIAGESPRLAGSGATWFVAGHRAELSRLAPEARVALVTTLESAHR